MTARESAPGSPDIPLASAQPCIWMAAGLVTYKLCPLAYDCDDCPFDLVMRGEARPRGDGGQTRRPVTREPLHFPEDRRYDPAHAWASLQPSDHGDRVRVGFDAFAAWLLGDARTVIVPPPGTPVERGRPGCWICHAAGLVPFRTPLCGVVSRVNRALRDQPRLAIEAPYEDGWLLEIGCEGATAAVASLLSASEMRLRVRAECAEAVALISAEARAPYTRVGATLADGGEIFPGARPALNVSSTRRLIERFLR